MSRDRLPSRITPPAEGPGELAPASPPWGDLRRAWGKYLKAEQSSATRTAYLRAMDRFTAWLRARAEKAGEEPPIEINLAAVQPADVAEWRESLRRSYALASVNLYLSGVRAFYAWAIEQGAPIANPAKGIKGRGKRGMAARKRDLFTDAEVLAILGKCDRRTAVGCRDHAILSLLAYCGLRTVEIQRAEVGDLEAKEGRQILWVWGKGRQGPDEYVVLPLPAENAIRGWLAHHPKSAGPLFCSLDRRGPGGRLSMRQLRRVILKRIRAVGIRSKRKTAHSFRHTAITNAIRHGATPIQAQHMARHLDIKTTLRYYQESDRLLDPAEDRIRYQGESEGSEGQ